MADAARTHFLRLICILIPLSLGACSSGMQKAYVDPDQVPDEGPALTFNPNDLQLIAVKMSQSLINTNILGNDRPIVRITQVKNKTSEHIDTKAITDKIRTTLIQSGKIRFLADKTEVGAEQDMLEEHQKQMNDTGTAALMDEKAKLQRGKMQGPRFHIYGEIISISTFDEKTKDVYYKMTLNMMNLETGILEWSEEKQLRKVGSRPMFGM